MPRPEKHVLVCTQNRPAGHPRGACAWNAGSEVVEAFFQLLQDRSAFDRVQVTATGCLGPCDQGPTVLVYPEGVMYARVTKDDVAAIFDEHLIGGKPLDRLRMPEDVWG